MNRAATKEEPDLTQADIPNIAMYRPDGYCWLGEEKDGNWYKKEENEDKCKVPLRTKRVEMGGINKKRRKSWQKTRRRPYR